MSPYCIPTINNETIQTLGSLDLVGINYSTEKKATNQIETFSYPKHDFRIPYHLYHELYSTYGAIEEQARVSPQNVKGKKEIW